VTFSIFPNEHGHAEIAVQVVRDAKNITAMPDKRLVPTGLVKPCWLF